MIFLKKFLKHGTRVASVAPSSRSMARELCRHVDPDRPQVIVELGAGTGAVTRQIVSQMHRDSRLIAVEIDQDFADRIESATWKRSSSKQADVLVVDVTNLDATLNKLGISKVDLVISGLPMPSLPGKTVASVRRLMHSYASDAWYSQLTEFPIAVYRSFYRRLFEHVEYRRVPVNIPPGGAYHCRVRTPIPGPSARN